MAPQKGLEGARCPRCLQPVYARCGEKRISHWAHRSVIDCDPWSEPETQWHRDWKNLFGDMQEQLYDKNGIKHLVDVKLPDETIIEFRRGGINETGKNTRAAVFGKQLLWVVDCAHRPRAVERFERTEFARYQEHIPGHNVFSTYSPDWCFPKSWANCNRFVFFDFGDSDVWCLFPRKEDLAICECMPKTAFVSEIKDGYAKFRERRLDIWRMVKARHR